MGTAGLKIKFIPVIKDFHKDSSQCCLEIVPEISAIQNFDQIEWKEENNLIEYTIPITYKIIIKKLPRETMKEINDGLNKMYYSCVDLSLPSSLTTFYMASGDINRINSDTYVITKVSAILNDIDDAHRLLLNLNGQKKKQDPVNNQNSTDEHNFKQKINKSVSNKDEAREDIQKHDATDKGQVLASEDTSSLNTLNINRKSNNKITNTESDFTLCTDACTQSGGTITCISTIMNSTSKGNSNRRLSQTPVCSIEAEISKRDEAPNSVIYCINEPNKDMTCITNICSFSNILNKNFNSYLKYCTKDSNVNRRKRILPEVRVAELVQVMEKEIMPLKIMLNEILFKCTKLRTIWKEPSPVSLMYKTIGSNFNDRLAQSCKKRVQSNRVVYSIVFDG